MKELTIEEKAKAYDGNYKAYTELINRLENVKEAIKKQNYGIAMGILCKPYPEFKITTSTELAESEDERVRKGIIKSILDLNSDWLELHGVTKENAITWLEKQGEQNPNEWKQENVEELTEFENAMMHIGSSFFGQHAGLDPNNTNAIKEQANLLLELVPKQDLKGKLVLTPEAYERILKLNGQNPAWSKEDEYCRHQLIVFCENCMVQDDGAKRCAHWLKFLKERYTWKPSDEQMEALLKLEEMHVLEHEKTQENAHLYMVVKSLREQLLKLREE